MMKESNKELKRRYRLAPSAMRSSLSADNYKLRYELEDADFVATFVFMLYVV
jgi:hypothetical protein